jgi:hypothetical protein
LIDDPRFRRLRLQGYRGEQIAQHRALRHLLVSWRLWFSVLFVAPAWIVAYVLAFPFLVDWWAACCAFWIRHLQLPASVVRVPLDTGVVVFDRIGIELVPAAITLRLWLVHAVATVAAFLWTFRFGERRLPLAYLVRIVCALEAATLAYFFFFEAAFPYEVLDHTRDFFGFTLFLHIVVPLLLAGTYYLLERSWLRQLAATAVIMAYYIAVVPFQLVAHAGLSWLLSPLGMPALYLLFGPMMNVLAFVALYSWVVTWGEPETN